uniref:Uncharacterized protein n=1 Tax=Bubo bubo TaxID=30461 RepID=A0A8C0EX03_BUBBB
GERKPKQGKAAGLRQLRKRTANMEHWWILDFLNLIHHAALEPTKKYSEPQTESQEIGWNTTPLVSRVLKDLALCRIQRGAAHHPERYSCKKINCDKHRKQE